VVSKSAYQKRISKAHIKSAYQKRISRHCQSKREQKLNCRVEQILLEGVNNPAFHSFASSR
jgi:hypothetical protein